MSDEILALLWTIGVFLFMGAWIALLESLKYFLSLRVAPKATPHSSAIVSGRGT
jgi:hypothetical protein